MAVDRSYFLGVQRRLLSRRFELMRLASHVSGPEIRAIDAALDRLTLGLYGVCKRCGAMIAQQRLDAIPYAIDCTGCAPA